MADRAPSFDDRRSFLRWLRAAAPVLGVAAAPTLTSTGCSRGIVDGRTRLPLADIPDGGRVRVVHLGDPVELAREGNTVRGRSLLCTHQGCEVRWLAQEGYYRCLCHDGRFAADGAVLLGPPTRPLRAIQVTVEGDAVLVGEPPAAP